MTKEIVQQGHAALRTIAEAVSATEISSVEIKKVIEDMKASLATQDDGLAIAAPQIGITKRIFVISGRLRKSTKNQNPSDEVFINPRIIRASPKKIAKHGEGCLSVRWLYGTVKRHANVTIEAQNEQGELFTENAGGMRAHIFQHEIDHLDGILFIDKATAIETHEPEK